VLEEERRVDGEHHHARPEPEPQRDGEVPLGEIGPSSPGDEPPHRRGPGGDGQHLEQPVVVAHRVADERGVA
jgi:hypothetical protein